jgi:poly(3-hydroxyalkanoate) synthetase
MGKENSHQTRFSPDDLFNLMGKTPADNHEGFETAVMWRSEMASELVKLIIGVQKQLDTIGNQPLLFGPWSLVATFQKNMLDHFFTNPIKVLARILSCTGQGTDIFIELNEWIERTYARLLYERCGYFIKQGKFDKDKAFEVTTTDDGKKFLENVVEEFCLLENNYHSRGLTRLMAMKELLMCLLMAITDQPATSRPLPFMPKNKDGTPKLTSSQYLDAIKKRLENLYLMDAFDIKTYSEKATGNQIGCSPYEVVQGSHHYGASLRYYPLPKGVEPNESLLYLVPPLINKPEIFDLSNGKSVIECMLKEGFTLYMLDNGDPGPDESKLGIDFYGKAVHDKNLALITKRHPGKEINMMCYCMGGTLILPYLARRAEERQAAGKAMDVKKVILMAASVKVDDAESGYAPVLEIIGKFYDPDIMKALYQDVNVPVQVIETGMNQTQFGVHYYVASGFYQRATSVEEIKGAAPFFYWLTHGTMFPAQMHNDWIRRIFVENQIYKECFCMPSDNPALDGRPVDMEMLKKAGIILMDYRGKRDMISPSGACVASEIWGQTDDLNRTVEKNIGHIFVVSQRHLTEFVEIVSDFLN